MSGDQAVASASASGPEAASATSKYSARSRASSRRRLAGDVVHHQDARGHDQPIRAATSEP